MGKIARRFLLLLVVAVMLAAVMGTAAFAQQEAANHSAGCIMEGDVNGDGVVNARDAICILYYSYGVDGVTVNQSCDFDSDPKVNAKDALYVLYAAFGQEGYTLNKTFHHYTGSVWSWNVVSGKASLQMLCGCDNHAPVEVEITTVRSVAATCTTAGSTTYRAEAGVDGVLYFEEKTVVSPALEHAPAAQWTTDGAQHYHICTNSGCTEKLDLGSHNWDAGTVTTEATCTADAVKTHTCAVCGETKTEEVENTAHHIWTYEGKEKLLSGCQYVKVYECARAGCEAEMDGDLNDRFYKHSHTATLTTPPTCQQPGVKTYRCACGDTYTTDVPREPEAHDWEETAVPGVYQCKHTGCDAGKTVAVVQKNETIDAGKLESTDELKVESDTTNVSVKVDESLKEIVSDKQAQLTVTEKNTSQIALDSELAAQIGTNPIYDFNLTVGGQQVSDLGDGLTISLPYTLQPGDDVDAIDVWFIKDNGEVDVVQGKYSNGFVTFTTTHFSYYTVTRLTAAQRCEKYGHNFDTPAVKTATCTEDGYTLELCSRCGHKQITNVVKAAGHKYVEKVEEVAATCTVSGSVTMKCACGAKSTEVLPALGHSMKLDESKSVAATCRAPGYKHYACDHDGCTEIRKEALKQLDHNYVDVHQDPTCDSKGFDKKICTNDGCGYELVISETAALGHAYAEDALDWNWAEDHLSATLTLRCSRGGCGHVQTLNAVVVAETAAANSCTGSGSVIYTATAGFNKRTYTDEYRQYLAPAGHKEQEGWDKNAAGHFHNCAVCGQKIETFSHSFDSGVVTKEATCVSAGNRTYTCTVCGYEKQERIPATGIHNVVDGACVDCEFVENTCEHELVRDSLLDLSAHGICEGWEIIQHSCDCGEVVEYELNDMGCRIEEPDGKRAAVTEDGTAYEIVYATCPACDLMIEVAQYITEDRNTCVATMHMWVRLSLGGLEVALLDMADAADPHEYLKPGEIIDLTQYGLCSEKLQAHSCDCGENVKIRMKESCRWMEDYESYTEHGYAMECVDCGARQQISMTRVDGDSQCSYTTVYTYTYFVDGQEVYSYSDAREYTSHANELVDYKLMGENCQDGIHVHVRCIHCGKETKDYFENHVLIPTERIDLADFGACGGQLVSRECMCEDHWQNYSLDGGCNFVQMYYDPDTETEVFMCETCGFTMRVRRDETEKGEDCTVIQIEEITFCDKSGKVVATTGNKMQTWCHNYEYKLTLLGQTCRDGVLVEAVCVDCGETMAYEEHEHYTVRTVLLDLSEYSSCGEFKLYKSECACGEESNVYGDNNCRWTDIKSEFGYGMKCVDCGIEMYRDEVYVGAKDQCNDIYHEKRTYVLNGNVLGVVEQERIHSQHDYHYEASLHPGATSCEEGFHVKYSCDRCGEHGSWDGYGRHYIYEAEKEIVSQGQFCTTVYRIVQTCPCGQSHEERYVFDGEECRIYEEIFSEEQGCWEGVCVECGVTRTRKTTREAIEGTCDMRYAYRYSFYRDGEEIFVYEENGIGDNHTWVYELELLGETCEDGYLLTPTCIVCGNSYGQQEMKGHEPYITERTLLYSGNGLCGPVYAVKKICACGYICEYEIDDNCDMQYVGHDHMEGSFNDESYPHYRCNYCDATFWLDYIRESQEDRCVDNVELLPHYADKNGNPLPVESFSYQEENHDYGNVHELLGNTCSDGYYVHLKCRDCGTVVESKDLRTEHEIQIVEEYDLSEHDLCGAEIVHSACACGQESSWSYYNYQCNWRHISYDTETQLLCEYCDGCRTYHYSRMTEAPDQGDCIRRGTVYHKFVRDDETLLEINGTEAYPVHLYVMTDAIFDREGGDCESGVTVMKQCVRCKDTRQEWQWGHQAVLKQTVDLEGAGCCGGALKLLSCPCGKNQHTQHDVACSNMHHSSYITTDAEGRTVNHEIRDCGECGLKLHNEFYEVYPEGSCEGTRYGTITAILGERVLGDITFSESCTGHEYQMTVTLQEGATTCEQGVYVNNVCVKCKWSFGYEASYHVTAPTTLLDLTHAGSICGGRLVRNVCACGFVNSVSMETDCDVDSQSVKHWIDGVIDDESHMLAEGQRWLDSESYVHTCAVTDPACSMKLRSADYWILEGCIATHYRIWEYYDAQTESYVQIAKDQLESLGWHDFADPVVTDCSTATYNGSISTYHCKNCQTYYTVTNHCDKERGSEIYHAREFFNTANTAEPIHYIWESKYEFTYTDEDGEVWYFQTESGYTATWADETETFHRTRYTYHPENPCNRTVTQEGTVVTGQPYTETYHYHRTTRDQETKKPTCTQFGERSYTEFCVVCKEIYINDRLPISPTTHDWLWDEATGMYRCSYCQLYNQNGASGQIVMEDMTEENGANFVVGYWNRGELEFVPVVSVILADGTERTLSDVTVSFMTVENDGVCAAWFSKQQAMDAAAAIAGQDAYSIRITFTPTSPVEDLEYAITFE